MGTNVVEDDFLSDNLHVEDDTIGIGQADRLFSGKPALKIVEPKRWIERICLQTMHNIVKHTP